MHQQESFVSSFLNDPKLLEIHVKALIIPTRALNNAVEGRKKTTQNNSDQSTHCLILSQKNDSVAPHLLAYLESIYSLRPSNIKQ